MYHDAEQRRQFIQACWDCRNECQETLFNLCLEMGGRHAEERHVKLMMDCIAICQTTADFMTRRSSMYNEVAGVCAQICAACADSCERIGGAEMLHCAEICRRCATCCAGSPADSQPIAA